MANELDKTIEELEAEVLSELEEANGADAPMKSAGKADSMEKLKGKTPNDEVIDTGAPVVDGKSKQAPSKKTAFTFPGAIVTLAPEPCEIIIF